MDGGYAVMRKTLAILSICLLPIYVWAWGILPVAQSARTVYTDNFNRGDGDVGANWTLNDNTGHTEPVISSNQLVHGEGGDNREFIYYNVGLPTNDQYSKATFVDVTDSWLLVRCQAQSSTENCYGLNVGPTGVDFYKWVSGNPTAIGSPVADTISNGDVIELHITGYTLSYHRNDVLKGSETDGTEQYSSGYVGIGSYDNTSIFDNWEGGDL
jgi:hypothetical protein